jgi:hypothetical protein
MSLQVFGRRPESEFSYAESRIAQMKLAMKLGVGMKCYEGTAWACENSYRRNDRCLGMLVVGKGGLPPLE